ncbi:MAG: hypothetical protein EOO41_00280 [Methanobacteriota archaeon]|nr:MAG: hypothetical protein EOO41_00280 [Euryarchaeota archaeon]
MRCTPGRGAAAVETSLRVLRATAAPPRRVSSDAPWFVHAARRRGARALAASAAPMFATQRILACSATHGNMQSHATPLTSRRAAAPDAAAREERACSSSPAAARGEPLPPSGAAFVARHPALTGFSDPAVGGTHTGGGALMQTVRELVHNAVDAGALHVHVTVSRIWSERTQRATTGSSSTALAAGSRPGSAAPPLTMAVGCDAAEAARADREGRLLSAGSDLPSPRRARRGGKRWQTASNDVWRIVVEDDGHGMASGDIVRLCAQLFSTSKAAAPGSPAAEIRTHRSPPKLQAVFPAMSGSSSTVGMYGVGLKAATLYAQRTLERAAMDDAVPPDLLASLVHVVPTASGSARCDDDSKARHGSRAMRDAAGRWCSAGSVAATAQGRLAPCSLHFCPLHIASTLAGDARATACHLGIDAVTGEAQLQWADTACKADAHTHGTRVALTFVAAFPAELRTSLLYYFARLRLVPCSASLQLTIVDETIDATAGATALVAAAATAAQQAHNMIPAAPVSAPSFAASCFVPRFQTIADMVHRACAETECDAGEERPPPAGSSRLAVQARTVPGEMSTRLQC